MTYKELYFGLFNDVTTAIEQLKAAQIRAEELYIDSDIADEPDESDEQY